METILQSIDGVACYLDDLIITGKSDKEHLDRLEEVPKRLTKSGVKVNRDKCRFFQDSVEFLGHRIDAPLPKLEDIFASLAGGKKFTVLDLKQAYNQFQLDEPLKKMVIINTHKGLYTYNRMPFGVASAPAIF